MLKMYEEDCQNLTITVFDAKQGLYSFALRTLTGEIVSYRGAFRLFSQALEIARYEAFKRFSPKYLSYAEEQINRKGLKARAIK